MLPQDSFLAQQASVVPPLPSVKDFLPTLTCHPIFGLRRNYYVPHLKDSLEYHSPINHSFHRQLVRI